jgi:mRNA interferase MazF
MARTAAFPRRGSVHFIRLEPAVGREIRKTRPAVIISNDHMNGLAATVLVMPITAGHYSYYHWISIDPPEGGLNKPSSIVTEQIRAVDKAPIGRRLGAVHPETMAQLEQAIRDHCGLPDGRVLG